MITVDHGVEYWVSFDDGTWIQIVNSKEADERLLASRYYHSNKATWFSVAPVYSRTEISLAESSDLELTFEERVKIDVMTADIRRVKTGMTAGWYDVVQVHSTH